MAELKPCPFCGGEAKTHVCAELDNEVLKIIYGDKIGVHCGKCGIATLPFTTEAEAIDAWNRRTEDGERTDI